VSDQIFWYATRSAGILAWFAATISLGVGLLMSSRLLGRRPTIPWLLDVHRYFSAMSILFLFMHLVTLWADEFVTLSVIDFVVPGMARVSGLSNMSLALGVLSAWILVLVEASSLIKKYLPAEFWHTLHLTSFGVVVMGLIHAIQTGSDVDNRALIALAVSLLTAIVLVLATRVFRVLGDRKYRYELTLAELEGGLDLDEATSLDAISDDTFQDDLLLDDNYRNDNYRNDSYRDREYGEDVVIIDSVPPVTRPRHLPAPPTHRVRR